MSASVDIRNYLTSDTTGVYYYVASRVYQNHVPSVGTLPFVWFRRRGVEYLNCLGETETKPWREFFDIECVSETMEEAEDVADAVRARLHCARGALGSTTTIYNWVDVRDQSDDYVPRNMQADEVLHVVSLDVEVCNV
jgi:hypothetical protein